MADVDYWNYQMETVLRSRADPWQKSIAIGTMLNAYLGGTKSLLDATAIVANELFALELRPKQTDFGKPVFWRALEAASRQHYVSLAVHRPLFIDVIRWRDAAIHRSTPLVVVTLPGPPSRETLKAGTPKLSADPSRDVAHLAGLFPSPDNYQEWLEPLALCKRWRPAFVAVCAHVCTWLAGQRSGG